LLGVTVVWEPKNTFSELFKCD